MTGRNHVNPSNVRTSCRTLHIDRIRIGIRTRCQINVDDSMTINRIHGIQLIQRKSFEENLIAAGYITYSSIHRWDSNQGSDYTAIYIALNFDSVET